MTTAIQSMGGMGKVVEPNKAVVDFHNKKYQVFLRMYQDQKEYRSTMDSWLKIEENEVYVDFSFAPVDVNKKFNAFKIVVFINKVQFRYK